MYLSQIVSCWWNYVSFECTSFAFYGTEQVVGPVFATKRSDVPSE